MSRSRYPSWCESNHRNQIIMRNMPTENLFCNLLTFWERHSRKALSAAYTQLLQQSYRQVGGKYRQEKVKELEIHRTSWRKQSCTSYDVGYEIWLQLKENILFQSETSQFKRVTSGHDAKLECHNLFFWRGYSIQMSVTDIQFNKLQIAT